jgi:two-component system phosphate regulon sensor histidine kinase PhoR
MPVKKFRDDLKKAIEGVDGYSTPEFMEKYRTAYSLAHFSEKSANFALACYLPLKPDDTVAGTFLPTFLPAFFIALAGAAVILRIATSVFYEPVSRMEQGTMLVLEGDHEYFDTSKGLFGNINKNLNRILSSSRYKLKDAALEKEQKNAIFYGMGNGIIVLDNELNILMANACAEKLLDMKGGFIGKAISGIVRNTALSEFAVALLKEKKTLEDEFVFFDKEEKYIKIRGNIISGQDNEPAGLLIELSDMTKIRNLENLRSDFVANVSHEIKTPITAIRASVETLTEGGMENREEEKYFMNIILRHTDRLIALIDDLLSLSRVEKENISGLDFNKFKISELIKNTIELCSLKAENKKITIAYDCDTGLVAEIAYNSFEQALVNLVDNAVKYTPSGGKVNIFAEEEKGDMIALSVKDNGPGIAEEHLPRLFERFYRVDKARSRKLGGTGLGLAIVKHIIKSHNGTIAVVSKAGHGTVFKILIPKKQP